MLNKLISIAVIAVLLLGGCNVLGADLTDTTQTLETTKEPISSSVSTTAIPAAEHTKPTQNEEIIEESEYILPNLSYMVDTEIFENIDEDKEIDITIEYPQISGMEDEKKQKRINELLKESAMGPYYDFLNDGGFMDSTGWPVEYTVVYATEDIFSVTFDGYIYAKGNAHGTNLLYATNIDLDTGERITTNELFNVSFRGKLRMEIFDLSVLGEKITKEDMSATANEMLEETIVNRREEFVDSHDNFYFGVDKFYIILPVMSDHHSFEANYDDLRDVMNMDNPIWGKILDVK